MEINPVYVVVFALVGGKVMWWIVTMIILRFTPNDKIASMGEFYQKNAAKFTLNDIVNALKHLRGRGKK